MKFIAISSAVVIASIAVVAAEVPMTVDAHISDFVGKLASLLKQETASALVSANAPTPAACWKEWGDKEPSYTSECATGEASMGRCYVPCKTGYQGFGPFCLLKSNNGAKNQEMQIATSYQREFAGLQGQDGVCPANTFTAGNSCVNADCPAALPFNCGVLCVPNSGKCTSTVATFTILLVKLVKEVEAGNYPAAIVLLKQVWSAVSAWPKCAQIEANGAASTEFLGEIEKFVLKMQQ